MWIVFSRSKSNLKVVSRAISLLTKECDQEFKNVPSHVSLVFNKHLMLEAVGGGVRLNFFPTFIQDNEIIAVFQYRGKLRMSDYMLVMKGAYKYHGQNYDYIGVAWFLFYILRRKIFGSKIPETNAWDKSNSFFCSELVEFIEGKDQSSEAPNQQMRSFFVKIKDYALLYDIRSGVDFKDWFKGTLEALRK